ncbi:MAG TPA: hypothetical protein VKQ72_10445, partial [Aggregatilineales bacterium]|nr:hypothetical protein [Aggregatilineales bacterium]
LQTPEGLQRLHAALLEGYRADGLFAWADLPDRDVYMWQHLFYHLKNGNETRDLIATAKDLRYILRKLEVLQSSIRILDDVKTACDLARNDRALAVLYETLTFVLPLLEHCRLAEERRDLLYNRLQHIPELTDLCRTFDRENWRPRIRPFHPLPDLPLAALTRVYATVVGSKRGLALSPDGSKVILSTDLGMIEIWDADTAQLLNTWSAHEGDVKALALSHDGQRIISGGTDSAIRTWALATGANLAAFEGSHGRKVRTLAISPDDQRIASGGGDGYLVIQDATTGEVQGQPIRGNTTIFSIVFAPTGDWLATGSANGRIRIRNAVSGRLIRTIRSQAGAVFGLAVSPDGQLIAAGLRDGTVRVWRVADGSLLAVLRGHWQHGRQQPIFCVGFNPDGHFLASGDVLGNAWMWELTTGKGQKVAEHDDEISSVAFDPHGEKLFTASRDTTAARWDRPFAAQITFDDRRLNRSWGRSAAFSPDGTSVVRGTDNGCLTLWDTQTGALTCVLEGHTRPILSVVYTPDGQHLVSGSLDGTTCLWNATTGELENEIVLREYQARIRGIAVSHSGRWLATATQDKRLRIWENFLDPHPPFPQLLRGHRKFVTAVAFSPEDDLLASGSRDGTIRIWDTATWRCLHTFTVLKENPIYKQGSAVRDRRVSLRKYPTSLAFSPDGCWLAATFWHGMVCLWRRESHSRFVADGEPFCGVRISDAGVYNATFSPDSCLLATVGTDEILQIWRVADRQCITAFCADSMLFEAAFHPTDRYTIAVSGERGLYWLRLEL